jgi:2'-5' RNA ligase
VRLFVAVRPPAAVRAQLAAALGRPVDRRWHLTLAFLGERPDAAPLAEALTAVGRRHAPLALGLAGGGTFGRRVLWTGLSGDLSALTALAQDVRDALGVVEERPFRPHLTLARGNGLVVPAGLRGFASSGWKATEVELVRSHLGRTAEHEVLHRAPLAAQV